MRLIPHWTIPGTLGGMSHLNRAFREPINGLTHLAGAILSLFGTFGLLLPALQSGNLLQVATFSVFGASLTGLYSASSAYHLLRVSEPATRWLRRLDHTMIYILIAGTYTPVCLIVLRGAWGWTLFGLIWALALAGMLSTLFYLNKPRWLSAGLYILMGWLVVVALAPLLQRLPPSGLFWAVLGGLLYTGGAVIYVRKRPNWLPGVFGFHELWHLFVLAGSAAHFIMVYSVIRFL